MAATPSSVHAVEFVTQQQRNATAGRRRQVESILACAEHLAPDDAFLLRQVFEHGLRIEDIARQARLPRLRVYRRVRILLSRIDLPLFRFVVGHASLLDPATRKVARLVVCHGLPQRETADRLGISLHQVRQRLARVQTLANL